MQFISQYESDDENKDDQSKVNPNATTNQDKDIPSYELISLKNIDRTPDVDISHLMKQKENSQITKFNSGFHIPNKQNHLTGYINPHTISDFNFDEQYHTFLAYGYAQDPTDFNSKNLVVDHTRNQLSLNKSLFGNGKGIKMERKKAKMKRMKYGNPGTGDFMGPWAINEGEEVFINPSGEMTEEQKEILKQMEERRVSKVEQDKLAQMKMLSVMFYLMFSTNLHLNST